MPDISLHVDVNASVGTPPASKFSFAATTGVFAHSITANRIDGPYASVAEVSAAGFTSGAAAAINAWATAIFAQNNGIDQVYIGRIDAGDADLTESLDEIEAAETEPAYFMTIESRLDADIALAQAWADARTRIVFAQSDDKAAAAMLAAQTANSDRISIWYHDTDAEYLDACVVSKGGGLNLDAPDGAGIWGYMVLNGIDFAALTTAEIAVLRAANGNYFGRLKGLSFTSPGVVASGQRVDVITSKDWFTIRAEEEILTLFVNAKKIPFTDAGINLIITQLEDLGQRGVLFGHIQPGTFVVDPLTLADVSSADKASRCLQLTGSFQLAGAIEKLTYDIVVEL